MLGDGMTHGRPVSSNHIVRVQPSMGMTVSLAVRAKNLSSSSRASSPAVMPNRSGIGNSPMNELSSGYSRTAPSMSVPLMGAGLSRTMKSMPLSAAACMALAIVAM